MIESLWAPWRLQYIENAEKINESGCIFDVLPSLNQDEENFILHRGQFAFVMLNAFPYATGHLMIAPYQHTNQLHELSPECLMEINILVAETVQWLQSAYNPQGFNIGVNLGEVAGAGIPGHVHWHVVPRWKGDTNFMTAVGQTKVMPQSLAETYQRITQTKQRLAGSGQ